MKRLILSKDGKKSRKLWHLGSLTRVQALLRLTETGGHNIFDNIVGLVDGDG